MGKPIANLISKYMMASYAYYVEDDPIITDDEYDNLCENLLKHWDTVVVPSDHEHKKYLCKDALDSGTGYHIKKYPTIIKYAVADYRSTK